MAATGKPITLATNGTVRELARGLTSKMIDFAVFDGELNVHEAHDFESAKRERTRLALNVGDDIIPGIANGAEANRRCRRNVYPPPRCAP